MTSFCLIRYADAAARDAIARRVLDACRRTLRPTAASVRIVSTGASDITLIAIVANDSNFASLVSSDESDTALVACFGDLDDRSAGVTCAEAIRLAYDGGGVDAVAAIDGCYAAAVYDKTTQALVLLQDGVGQRTIRYAISGQAAVVSPHDLPLVATGLVPIEYDLTTAASIVSLGWSVGDSSLLTRISACAPGEIRMIARNGVVQTDPHPFHAPQRLRADDPAAVETGREVLIESLRTFIPSVVGAEAQVKVELSAGFDSRAVLGAAVSTVVVERLAAFSDGDPASLDVDVASKVAKRMGVRFAGGVPEDAGDAARLEYITGLAIDTNGQANALVGMTDFIPRDWEPALPSLCGDGGEIFRGYYYPKLGGHHPRPADPTQLAKALLSKSAPLALRFNDRIEQALTARIKQRATFIAQMAGDQSDALDLLYLLERFAVWNQKLRRNRHQRLRTSPFFSRAAIRAFLALPAPRGSISKVHETLVCRFARPTLSIPVNREFYVGLLTGNRIQRLVGRALVLHRKVVRKVRKKLFRGALAAGGGGSDLESVRAQRFVQLLRVAGERLLCGEQSVGPRLFGREAMRTMLTRAMEGDRSDIQTLGALLTAELWLEEARAIRSAALERGMPDAPAKRQAVRSA